MKRQRQRIAVAAVIGALAGLLAYWTRRSVTGFSDFDSIWLADRALFTHTDPFAAALRAYASPRPLVYPIPAVILTAPLAILPESVAVAAFVGVGFGVLAFGLCRTQWWPLVALCSLPAVECAQLGQWSGLSAAIAVLPSLAFLAVAKPTTAGAICVAYLPRTLNRVAVIGALLLLVAATVVVPSWIVDWRHAVAASPYYAPLVLRSGGIVLLLAVFRWRRPEARLIIMLAITPLSGMAYDALPLALIPETRREAMVLAFASFAVLPWRAVAADNGAAYQAAITHNAPLYIAALYLPALVMVLRRPNHAAVSAPTVTAVCDGF